MLQVEAALVFLRSGALQWLEPGAPIVLTAACPDGLGSHGLFGPGGRLCRVPAVKSFLRDHPLWLFAPGVSEDAARTVLWSGYPYYADWAALTAALASVLPPQRNVGTVPCGPMQVAA
jgi:hypothetical protein